MYSNHCFLTIKRVLQFCSLVIVMAFSSSAFSQEIRLLTFGDSLTAGLKRNSSEVVTCPSGVSREIGRYEPEEEVEEDGEIGEEENQPRFGCYGNGVINSGGYQPQLATLLSLIERQPEIVNYGFSGISTANMLSVMNQVFASQSDADYMLIFGGANDVVDASSSGTVIANLSVIVEQAKSRGITPVMTTVTRNIRNPLFDSLTVRYTQAIKLYAEENDILYVDPQSATFADWEDYHSGDGLHLNADGDNLLANLYFELVQEVEEGLREGSGVTVPIAAFLLLLLD